jgi:hypothetical protein
MRLPLTLGVNRPSYRWSFNRLERRQKKSFHVILFQPRAIEIYGFTDEGVARSFTEFLGETVATSPLGRGEAYASGFVILIILIHEL